MIDISSTIDGAKIAKRVMAQLEDKYTDVTARAAEAVDEAYKETVDVTFADRPETRRHGVRLRDSMVGKAETSGGGFPMVVSLELAPGASEDKVRVLDEGGGGHSRDGSPMWIPTTGASKHSGFQAGLFSASTDAFGGDERRFTHINHPGVKRPGKFLKKAIQAGVRAIRTGA